MGATWLVAPPAAARGSKAEVGKQAGLPGAESQAGGRIQEQKIRLK